MKLKTQMYCHIERSAAVGCRDATLKTRISTLYSQISIPYSLLLICILSVSCTSISEKQAIKPNIIFIMADDLGYNELGCYGQEWIKTPHIDQLAEEGMSFSEFYSGSAVCAPSRCVLLTGMHSGHAFIRDNHEIKPEGQLPIPDSIITLAEVMKQNGYATAAIGKWGLGYPGSEGDPNNQGFDLFYGYNCQRHAHNHYPWFLWKNDKRDSLEGNDRTLYGKHHSQTKFTEEALGFIHENKEQPFFLYLPFAIPHLAIQATDEALAEYVDVIPEEEHKHRGYIKHPTPRAGYAAMITQMDKDIGKILQLIADLGLEENTIVFFTSDNGPTYGRLGGSDSEFFKSNHPFTGLKGSLGEGGIRVPLIAKWPDQIQAGSKTEHQGAFQDVFSTVLDLSGLENTVQNDGISFAPTLLGDKQTEQHEYLYWEFPSYGGQQAVRYGKWKAIKRGLFKNPDNPFELYDLKTDITESTNVADQFPEVIKEIEDIARTARVPSKEFPFEALDTRTSKVETRGKLE